MRRSGSLFAACLWFAGLAPAAAQPAPAPTPIAVPTLAPADPLTQAIVQAAAGLLDGILTRNRIAAANSARGTVSYFRRFELQVRTGPNAYRNVHLHPGTVIDPRGATPAGGSAVDVVGRGNPDGSLDADTITVLAP